MGASDDRDPRDLLGLIPVVIVAVILIYLLYPKKRCWDCRKRLRPFGSLDPDQQSEVLDYYHEHEGRTPDARQLRVCTHCRYVFDEYSLRDQVQTVVPVPCKVCDGYLVRFFMAGIDPADMAEFAKAYPRLFTGEKCPRCRSQTMTTVGCALCDVAEPLSGCRACTTIHAWVPGRAGGMQYFTPLTDEPALERFLSKPRDGQIT